MSVSLPIRINASLELYHQFNKIMSVCNKLEAQFNFQTMTAGWYGDEENILNIRLLLETPADFDSQKSQKSSDICHQFADDVVCFHNEKEQKIDCIVAVTESEQSLLLSQEKLLAGYIQAKLQKVLNLVADKTALHPI